MLGEKLEEYVLNELDETKKKLEEKEKEMERLGYLSRSLSQNFRIFVDRNGRKRVVCVGYHLNSLNCDKEEIEFLSKFLKEEQIADENEEED